MTKPYFEIGGITIYHGDCNEILPTLETVDLVIADPPYGMGYVSHRRKVTHEKIQGDDALPVETIIQCIDKANNAAYICCRWNNIKQLPEPKDVIVWNKGPGSGMGDLLHSYIRRWEAVLFYPKENHKFSVRPQDVINCKITKSNIHPTEKPIDLMAQLISSNYGDIVLDPFMGSGTALVAAKMLGRKGIGIELEERYCETAALRLSKSDTLF